MGFDKIQTKKISNDLIVEHQIKSKDKCKLIKLSLIWCTMSNRIVFSRTFQQFCQVNNNGV